MESRAALEPNEYSMRDFVEKFVPDGWVESIGRVSMVPYWSERHFNKFLEGDFSGVLLPIHVTALKEFFRRLAEIQSRNIKKASKK